jgi:Na+/citrate or Na+/malate symporter
MNDKTLPTLPTTLPDEEVQAGRLLSGWWRIMHWRVGILPLPVFLALLGIIVYFSRVGKIPTEISMMMAVLAVGGFACAEVGRRIPLLHHIGGAAIFAAIVPSALTYYHVIPTELAKAITGFLNNSSFFYVFISVLIVGSILSMDRVSMIKGVIKMLVPIGIGSIMAMLVGLTVGRAMGLGLRHTFYYIVAPIMSGGLSTGGIPLATAYADILHLKFDEQFAQILPVIMLGSITAIMLSGLMNFIGKKYPRLSGGGSLQPDAHDHVRLVDHGAAVQPEVKDVLAAGSIAITLYLVGVTSYRLWGWPAPLMMLFLAAALKLIRAVPPNLEQASFVAFRYFTVGVTYPVLFAFGVALTPWDKLIATFSLPNLVTIIATVTTMMTTGFVTARLAGVFPIEMSILNACHCSHGAAGDVAILTAANRMQLMPFAQISTRIGGLITVTLALIVLRMLV